MPPMTPEKFFREKVRALPIAKCLITPDWQESGISNIFVLRQRKDGNFAVGMFLVDTFCLGVKDATYHPELTQEDLDEYMADYEADDSDLEEISYNEVHNIIYGAIDFAEDAGIYPAKDFAIAKYALEEDTDNIPLIEYDFGKNGKHYLVIYPDGDEARYVKTLQNNLAPDEFDFLYLDAEDDEDEEEEDNPLANFTKEDFERALSNMHKIHEEMNRHPSEAHSYDYPEYPMSLSVKHQFIVSEFYDPEHMYCIPDETIDRILALPADEAVDDITKILLFRIGQYHTDPEAELTDGVVVHSMLFLTQIGSEKGLDAVLEVLRQDFDFIECHIGDIGGEILTPALYACGLNRTDVIMQFLSEPGHEAYQREYVASALAMILVNHPERRDEIISLLRKHLKDLLVAVPQTRGGDACYAGFLISILTDIQATELLPEIKALYDADCVDLSGPGTYDSVLRDMNDTKCYAPHNYKLTDIRAQYARLQQ